MKKIIVALMLSLSIGLATSAKAAVDPFTAVTFALGILVGTQFNKEVPYHLTDACKPQTLQSSTGTTKYISYEHCLKK